MPASSLTSATGGSQGWRREYLGKVLRYAAGSVVATICSEVTFVLLYGVAHTRPVVASVVAWLAGALPNYWLNRSWTWRRQGRPSFTRELLPYIGIVLVTLLLAAVATSTVDNALTSDHTSSGVRIVLVGGTFLGVYAVVFLLRFFLLDRLFRMPAGADPHGRVDPMSAKESV